MLPLARNTISSTTSPSILSLRPSAVYSGRGFSRISTVVGVPSPEAPFSLVHPLLRSDRQIRWSAPCRAFRRWVEESPCRSRIPCSLLCREFPCLHPCRCRNQVRPAKRASRGDSRWWLYSGHPCQEVRSGRRILRSAPCSPAQPRSPVRRCPTQDFPPSRPLSDASVDSSAYPLSLDRK